MIYFKMTIKIAVLILIIALCGFVFTSANGMDWTAAQASDRHTLHAVHYANSLWVAVGNNRTILTSADGTNWTERASGTNGSLSAVYYANSQWVAVGYDDTSSGGIILTAP